MKRDKLNHIIFIHIDIHMHVFMYGLHVKKKKSSG